jgi:hypothetical protein
MASGATGTYGLPYPLQTDGVDVAADVQSLATAVEIELLLKAPLDSPTFIGNPTAPTPSNSDNDTSIATTAFVKNQGYLTAVSGTSTFMPLAGGNFTGAVSITGQPIVFSDGTAMEGRFVAAGGAMYLQAGQSAADTTGVMVVARNTTTSTNIASFDVYADSHYVSGITGLGVASSSSTRLNLSASTTSVSPLRIAHGTAPSSPVNGDIWTTTIGMYARINGNTVGPFGTGATYTNSAPTAITGALWANSDYNSLSVYTGSRWASMTGTTIPTAKTATYTLALGDEGSAILMNGATTNNITVPTNATAAFPIGSAIIIVQVSGVQTVISGAGVTFYATPGLKLRTQYSMATLLKVATDTWVVTGDVIA